ncbi:sporulation initiation factor Spo0A C-terminal domain-containing protein [Desulforamulus hydrothermalis]|uniref:Sporulation initiation factor Spo0A n=1 Tax=Desulforamulus hydrothermalis Lam5 = DSM 18033 TaxID=1121428 RepID=K8DZ41_9FIRM|nr:sporulation initiation factor Spo0A C-terminal domain-containing protein [Desulforamulus hydrothermalis]CCO08244.1 Sporulation initiation factor Spo0A [Desulforamulus hydrothermalis Lam5 = DSM 18033]SHH43593.1 two-component system, response regulator, stage 0 sporulation protein A [Desulforamulus hydrothermalis Lam5 = DSM 18033]
MQVNTLETMENLKDLAERFLTIYPQLKAALTGQTQQTQTAEPQYANPDQQISQFLRELGTPMHVKGFGYLKTAIKLLQENESLLFAVTKELYPAIAKLHDTTPSRVERAIRHAVELMAERCSPLYAKSFTDQPTNSEFLAWCVENLKFRA